MNLERFLSSFHSFRLQQQVRATETEEDDGYLEMVQTYGIASADAADPGINQGGEQAALLGGDRDSTVKRVNKSDGHASLFSCIANLMNTIVGSGPYIFQVIQYPANKLINLCIYQGCSYSLWYA